MKMWKLLVSLLVLALIGCASTSLAVEPGRPPKAYTAGSLEEHAALGLSVSAVEPWEDGARTSGGRGTYEWWYFDFSLDDGSTLVIVFMTKDITRPDGPLTPVVTFTYDGADGVNVMRTVTSAASEYSAARDRCDVRIGACSATGDLRDYAIRFEEAEVQADLRLHGTVPPWRPGTGHAFFGLEQKSFFAWLPSVPQGTVSGTVTVAGASRGVTGVGYHDHNWGNAPLPQLVHHWYWGRARIGDYTLIASSITAAEAYGGVSLPVFMLARGDSLLAEDAAKVRFTADDLFTDPYTGKPVAGRILYDYKDDTSHYRVSFRRARDLARVRFLDILPPGPRLLARLSCFDGGYLRFTGRATLERFEGGEVVETVSQESAVWELMYFGHAPG